MSRRGAAAAVTRVYEHAEAGPSPTDWRVGRIASLIEDRWLDGEWTLNGFCSFPDAMATSVGTNRAWSPDAGTGTVALRRRGPAESPDQRSKKDRDGEKRTELRFCAPANWRPSRRASPICSQCNSAPHGSGHLHRTPDDFFGLRSLGDWLLWRSGGVATLSL
jgi:hypothetical protein